MSRPERAGRRRVGMIVLVLAALFAVCVTNAWTWVGRPFPGFFVLENNVVVSIGRTEWRPATRRSTHWTRVIAVDGEPVADGRQLVAYVAGKRIGQDVTYSFRQGAAVFRLALPVKEFRVRDFVDLFAPMLATGLLTVLAGAIVVARYPTAPHGWAFFRVCASFGTVLITGPDEYSPFWFVPLYLLGHAAIPAALVDLALTYPQPRLRDHRLLVRGVLYAAFLVLGLLLITYRADVPMFLRLLYTVYFFTANAVVVYAGGLLLAMLDGARPRCPLVLALAAVLASSLSVVIVVSYPLLTQSISPIMLVVPLLMFPVITAVALGRYPVPHLARRSRPAVP
jgi:hypothetical protein